MQALGRLPVCYVGAVVICVDEKPPPAKYSVETDKRVTVGIAAFTMADDNRT